MSIARPSLEVQGDDASRDDTDSLIDAVLRWRDRCLADRRFQRFAARFPPTRWIARRRAGALFDLVAGFTYSQVLQACVRLGLFELLLARPRTSAEIASHTGLADDATDRLLAAAIALRLVERRQRARFGLGPLGAPLADGRAIGALVEHHAVLYADLADPVALLRGQSSKALASVWGYAANTTPGALDDARVAGYSQLMTASQPLVADQILDAYPLGAHRRLLDVGGGEGGFAIAAARRHPRLSAAIFDLPAVAARAAVRVRAEGLASRITAIGGDFGRDRLPLGCDVASLVRVIHDHDDATALAILRAVHAALPDDGVLLLAEPMAGTSGAEAMGDAYFGMYLLAMGSGRPRTADRLHGLIASAGFRQSRGIPTSLPLQTGLIVARK